MLWLSCTSEAATSTYTIEVPWSQTASMYSTNCCTYSSLSGFNGTYTYTQKCSYVYGSCVGSKRGAFWIFDLSGLPEDATILSASFKGDTEYNDMGGDTTLKIKPTSGTLTNTFAHSIINSASWSSSLYTWGGPFSLNIPATQIESARSQGKLGIYMYVFNGGGVHVVNSGPEGARLSIVIDIESPSGACCLASGACAVVPQHTCELAGGTFVGEDSECADTSCSEPCIGDVDGNGSVDVTDLLAIISAWGPCSGCDEDIDGNGAVDVSDLLAIISAWGTCN
ncbi:MAG: hypothetical protein CMJ36_04385 [Phycisphaerae bacterium]|nr:hypothetical protein [Phycisphaerae bacterium]